MMLRFMGQGRIRTHVCVIGAGPSGLAAAKNCIEHGLSVTVFEKSDAVGGNWVFREGASHSSVYETTHIISSRFTSEFQDFPFPDGTPAYPSHKALCKYFQDYARHFGVIRHIKFNTEVIRALPVEDGWEIETRTRRGKSKQHFSHLMTANGHHWDPAMPELKGRFTGQMLHSHAYKKAAPFRGKRVLVIGGGNSAADIAVECSRVAAHVSISMRRGHWFLPKFLLGLPGDALYYKTLWIPSWIRQHLLAFTVKLLQGKNSVFGLQDPSYNILEGHPTVNSELLYYVGHGEIQPRTGVERVAGKSVHFSDGSTAEFDVIIAATGYHVSFPFLASSLADFKGKTEIRLWRKMFHETQRSLYFIGLFQPLGCIWVLADLQARLACLEIQGRYTRPADLSHEIDKEISRPHFKFQKTPRHAVEVDYFRFRRELLHEIEKSKAL